MSRSSITAGGYRGSFGSVDVVVSDQLQRQVYEQYRFPKSKRKRIRRKWHKDSRNWRTRIEGPEALWVGGRYYCTPDAYERLLAALR